MKFTSKQKHGKQVNPLKEAHPSAYQLEEVCESDIAAAKKKMFSDLRSCQETSGETVDLLQVIDIENAIAATVLEKAAVEVYVPIVGAKVKAVNNSNKSEEMEQILAALKPDAETRNKTEQEISEQTLCGS